MKNEIKQIFDPTYLKGGEMEIGAKKNGWHDSWREEKVFMFTWEWCSHCQTMMVICPCCGNNCCNAGFGNVDKNGNPVHHSHKVLKSGKIVPIKGVKKCPVCNLAYQFQALGWKHKDTPPEPSDEEKNRQMEKAADDIDKIFS